MPHRFVRSVAGLLGLVVALSLMATFLPAATAQQSTPDVQVVRIRAATFDESRRLSERGLDLLEMRDGDDLFAIVDADEIKALRADGFDVRPDADQTATLHTQQRSTVQDGFRTVEEGYALLDQMQALHPTLAQRFSYGQSWDKHNPGGPEGYDLRGITLTNQLIPGPKPTFVLISAIHAREMTTAEINLRLIEYLLGHYGSDPDVTWLLDEQQIVIVPFVNPDGRKDAETYIPQRKNKNIITAPCSGSRAGIDLNRNSSFHWGAVDKPSLPKCSETYPGPSAASEPEVASLQTWIRGVFTDQRGPDDDDPAPDDATGVFISLHSYSNLVLWPYGWDDLPAPNAADLAGLGTKMASYNSYTPQQSVDLYPTSGTTDDWTYGEFGVASYTFEIGPEFGTCAGFFPPYACLDGQTGGSFWSRNLPALLYAFKVARTPYLLQRGPDALSLSVTDTHLTATINDSTNGNRPIAAAEMYIDAPPWRDGTPIALTAADGTFNTSKELVTGRLPTVAGGRHLVYVRGQDIDGNWGPCSAVWLNVPTDQAVTLAGETYHTGAQGTTLAFALWLTNQSTVSQTYDLALTDHTWSATLQPLTATLNAGQSQRVVVTVNVPATAPYGTQAQWTVTATSRQSTMQTTQVTLTAVANTTSPFTIYLPIVHH